MARAPRDNHRGIVVLLALLICAALNAIHQANVRSRGHDPVTGMVRDAALIPAQTATVRVSRWFKTNVVSLFQGPRLAHQNQVLRAKVLALSVENKQLADAQAENDRLRALLDFKRKSPKPLLAAEVTALKPSPQTDTVVLNRGLADGVHLHSIVRASNGALVGQVIDVSSHSCTAIMLTDAGWGVGAQVIPTKTPAVDRNASSTSTSAANGSTTAALPHGAMGPPAMSPAKPPEPKPTETADAKPAWSPTVKPVGVCRAQPDGQVTLTYLPSDSIVKPGDLVSTSGVGRDFPAGIPIGVVISVTTNPTLSMKTATIRPAADLDHLNEDNAFIQQ